MCCASGQTGCDGACCDSFCCDDDGDYVYDDCTSCTVNGQPTCKLCNTDGLPGNDSCYLCDTDGDTVNDSCYTCDLNGDGTLDGCPDCACASCGGGGAAGGGSQSTPKTCKVCDSTPKDSNNVKDSCWLCDNPTHASDPNDQSDDNNDCYLCDSTPDDGHNVNDACMLCDDPYHSTDPTNQKSKNNSCYPCKNKIAGTQNDDCYRCDLKKADGTPGKDGKFDTCYGYDTDGDGIKDSCCPDFKVELTFSADFPGRSKTKAGVGEIGTLEVIPASLEETATFSSSDPTCVDIDPILGGWSALERDTVCSANLCATINGCETCKTLTVTPPTGTRLTRTSNNVWHIQGYASAGIELYYWLDPKDVTFENVRFGEGTAPAENKTGIFVTQAIPHPQNIFGAILRPTDSTTGSRVERPDHAAVSFKPWGDGGTFTWNIPTQWIDTGDMRHDIDHQLQQPTIQPNGDTTISKDGQDDRLRLMLHRLVFR